jgi:hypothetical protein
MEELRTLSDSDLAARGVQVIHQPGQPDKWRIDVDKTRVYAYLNDDGIATVAIRYPGTLAHEFPDVTGIYRNGRLTLSERVSSDVWREALATARAL